MIRCCQSMLTLTFAIPRARRVWITCRLLRIVELVVVDQPVEAFDRCAELLDRRDTGEFRLIAARVEPGCHSSERPDSETRLHEATLSSAVEQQPRVCLADVIQLDGIRPPAWHLFRGRVV